MVSWQRLTSSSLVYDPFPSLISVVQEWLLKVSLIYAHTLPVHVFNALPSLSPTPLLHPSTDFSIERIPAKQKNDQMLAWRAIPSLSTVTPASKIYSYYWLIFTGRSCMLHYIVILVAFPHFLPFYLSSIPLPFLLSSPSSPPSSAAHPVSHLSLWEDATGVHLPEIFTFSRIGYTSWALVNALSTSTLHGQERGSTEEPASLTAALCDLYMQNSNMKNGGQRWRPVVPIFKGSSLWF